MTTAVLFAAAYMAAGELAVDSWPALLLAVAATAPVGCLLAASVGLSRTQRRRVVTRARELARARRSR